MSAVDVLSETELEVRDALPDDVHAIAAIYAWHVLHGRASFEEVPRLSTKCASA
jgi:phosphinothricin acetyltransferase